MMSQRLLDRAPRELTTRPAPHTGPGLSKPAISMSAVNCPTSRPVTPSDKQAVGAAQHAVLAGR